MIELIQFPWSPFCLVQRRILEYSGVRFKITNIPSQDRSLVWRLTRQRYYGVPIMRDGRTVVFETDEDSQVIAKYLDAKLQLDLFPERSSAGWTACSGGTSRTRSKAPASGSTTFIGRSSCPRREQLAFLRHKERKFGRGCLDQWRAGNRRVAGGAGAEAGCPLNACWRTRPFLLRAEPHFVDFDLWGMLANFLYSGHYQLPAAHTCLRDWHGRMSHVKKSRCPQ